jgi:lysophospholipase L1-like esterase
MRNKCARKALMECSLLLFWIGRPCQAITVATVGDSFADSFYNAIRARPDLVQRYGVHLIRWSRPIIGLTRTDYFDYTRWLRDSTELGSVDVCFVQIGSNDMQSIPLSKKQWIPYGSPPWREAYASRTREMALTLTERRCGLLMWVLQPGFEKQDALACHRELINEVQREALRLTRTRVLEISTSEAAYGRDKTHFNRAYVLQLGLALFRLVDTSRQILHMGCLSCHRNMEELKWDSEIFPLRTWRRELAAPVWAPERVGVQCRIAVPRPVRRPRKVTHPRRRALA